MIGDKKAGSSAAAASPAAETETPGAEEQLAALTDAPEEGAGKSAEETDADKSTEEAGEESLPDETDGETDETDGAEEADDAEDEADEDTGTHRKPAAERRIGELTAKRKAAEARAETAETRVKELEASAMSKVAVQADYLSAPERQLIEQANELEADLAWAAEAMSTGGTHPRSGKELTAQEVGKEFGRLMGQQGTIARAHAVYERAQALQWEDAKRGRAIRLAGADKKPTPAAKPALAKKPVMTVVKPGAAAGKPVSESAKRQGVDIKRFEKAGATHEALAMELANL